VKQVFPAEWKLSIETIDTQPFKETILKSPTIVQYQIPTVSVNETLKVVTSFPIRVLNCAIESKPLYYWIVYFIMIALIIVTVLLALCPIAILMVAVCNKIKRTRSRRKEEHQTLVTEYGPA